MQEDSERKWEEQNRKWWEAQAEDKRKWEEQNRKWHEEQAEDKRKWEEQNRKWEEQNRKWDEAQAENKRKWEEQNRKWHEEQAENKRKWEEQNRKWNEQDTKWSETQAENKRNWEEQNRKWNEQDTKWRETQAEEKRKEMAYRQEFQQMHEEIMAIAQRHERSIGALGARWGLQTEKAFRNALAAILEKSFGVEVMNVNEYDDAGMVFGRPDQVELDVIIQNGLLIIAEIKSSIDKAGMYIFERKVRFYEQKHQRTAQRMMVISPMVEPKALPVAQKLGIEVYSDSMDVQTL
jgi:hypothetical protein